MVQKKRNSGTKLLTEVELELMNVIWDKGECTIKEVQAALPRERDLAYTTVATMVKILEQKKALGSRKGEKAHSYFPLLAREDYEATSLRHLADNLFHGDSSSMVMRLLNEPDLTTEELAAIRKLLDERLGS